jgi:hypothetical protein
LPVYKGALSMTVLNNQLFLGTDQRAVWSRSIAAVLPITLQSFTAIEKNGIVNLNWKTATGGDGKYFDVERSIDGRHFVSIGTVQAAADANGHTYNLEDVQPNKGINYYRIEMVEKDGSKKYSSVILVNIKTLDRISMIIAPNPVVTQGTISLTGDLKGTTTIDVYDLSGRRVVNLYSGELNSNAFSTTLNQGVLKQGVYVLKLHINGEELTRKLFVQ